MEPWNMESKSNPALSVSLPSKQLPFAVFTVYTILSRRFMGECRGWHVSCDTLEVGNIDWATRSLASFFSPRGIAMIHNLPCNYVVQRQAAIRGHAKWWRMKSEELAHVTLQRNRFAVFAQAQKINMCQNFRYSFFGWMGAVGGVQGGEDTWGIDLEEWY